MRSFHGKSQKTKQQNICRITYILTLPINTSNKYLVSQNRIHRKFAKMLILKSGKLDIHVVCLQQNGQKAIGPVVEPSHTFL